MKVVVLSYGNIWGKTESRSFEHGLDAGRSLGKAGMRADVLDELGEWQSTAVLGSAFKAV